MKMKLIIILSFIYCFNINAQRLSYDNTMEVVLNEGLNVYLYKSLDANKWYYLPPSKTLRLSKKEDQTPEFLFLKYTQEQKGKPQGALMHFLFEWGLTNEQLSELRDKVKTLNGGDVTGPVDLLAAEKNSFKIVSAVLANNEMTSNFQTSGHAPPLPGGRAAVACLLDATGAQLIDATFQKARSISDVSVVLNYDYIIMVDAAKGRLEYNWDLFQEQYDGMAIDYIKEEMDNRPEKWEAAINWYNSHKDDLNNQCGLSNAFDNILISAQAIDVAIGNTSGSGNTGSAWEYGASENVMRNIYDFLEEKEVITLEFEINYDDDRLAKIQDAFFEYFLNGFAEESLPDLINTDRTELQDPVNPVKDNVTGGYSFKGCAKLTTERSRSKVLKFDKIRLPVKRSYQMVFNLADAYDRLRNNRKCIAEEILNDPFFTHRSVNFIVDVEAIEIFEKEINNINVKVRKKRRSGRNFEDDLNISRNSFNNGNLKTLEYTKAKTDDPSEYEYMVQWTLRKNVTYPRNPRWQKGEWKAVTLSIPVTSKSITFEADKEDLKNRDIVNAALLIRYQKFNVEYEETISLRTSSPEAIAIQMIYVDQEYPNYIYKVVLTNKQNEKIADPVWHPMTDGYVFAAIPDSEDAEWLKWLEAGKELLETGYNEDGKEITDPLEKILDKIIRAAQKARGL